MLREIVNIVQAGQRGASISWRGSLANHPSLSFMQP